MKLIRLFLFFCMLAVGGCGSLPKGFSMYPEPLRVTDVIQPDTAIILVGVSGEAEINYLQFTHSSTPAINVRFTARGNALVAVSVPVGIKGLSLGTISVVQRPSGYLSNGTPYGYVPIRTQKIDIDKRGLYYIATLETNSPGQFQTKAIPDQLKDFRELFRETVGNLEPVNFQWPI